MANIKLTAAPLSGGGDIDIAGNRIIIRDDLALVSVATPLGGEDALKKTLTAEIGLKVPAATLSSTAKGMRAVSMAPDAMLLIFAHATPDAEMHVRAKLGGAGYMTDQTDSMLAIEVSGPATMAAMERICPLDLAEELAVRSRKCASPSAIMVAAMCSITVRPEAFLPKLPCCKSSGQIRSMAAIVAGPDTSIASIESVWSVV